MRSSNTALKRSVITDEQIQNLLVLRESLDAIKKRYELLENTVKATEQDLIALVESGVDVLSNQTLQIRKTERRYPSWKSYYVEVAGAEAADQVLASTTPTVQKTLIIK